MRLVARWGLLLLIFAVALVFFGSVVCPPLDERAAEDAGEEVQYPLQEDPGTYKPLPGDLQIEDRFPQRETESSSRTDIAPTDGDTFLRIEVFTFEEQGRPLEGVGVRIMTADLDTRTIRAKGTTDADGRFLSPELFPEQVVVELDHGNHFPATGGPFTLPSTEQVRFECTMRPAGVVVGKVLGVDGKPQSYGRLHLENPRTGESLVLPIRARGAFSSPPLKTGNWRLRWQASPTEEQDPALSFSFPLEPKQRRSFLLTIPVNGVDPGQGGAGSIGIEEVLR
ncbi:MAG: hypothetical protein ACYSU1_02770 [Planctomycetota bacterium]|jgi:hypothetical protein